MSVEVTATTPSMEVSPENADEVAKASSSAESPPLSPKIAAIVTPKDSAITINGSHAHEQATASPSSTSDPHISAPTFPSANHPKDASHTGSNHAPEVSIPVPVRPVAMQSETASAESNSTNGNASHVAEPSPANIAQQRSASPADRNLSAPSLEIARGHRAADESKSQQSISQENPPEQKPIEEHLPEDKLSSEKSSEHQKHAEEKPLPEPNEKPDHSSSESPKETHEEAPRNTSEHSENDEKQLSSEPSKSQEHTKSAKKEESSEDSKPSVHFHEDSSPSDLKKTADKAERDDTLVEHSEGSPQPNGAQSKFDETKKDSVPEKPPRSKASILASMNHAGAGLMKREPRPAPPTPAAPRLSNLATHSAVKTLALSEIREAKQKKKELEEKEKKRKQQERKEKKEQKEQLKKMKQDKKMSKVEAKQIGEPKEDFKAADSKSESGEIEKKPKRGAKAKEAPKRKRAKKEGDEAPAPAPPKGKKRKQTQEDTQVGTPARKKAESKQHFVEQANDTSPVPPQSSPQGNTPSAHLQQQHGGAGPSDPNAQAAALALLNPMASRNVNMSSMLSAAMARSGDSQANVDPAFLQALQNHMRMYQSAGHGAQQEHDSAAFSKEAAAAAHASLGHPSLNPNASNPNPSASTPAPTVGMEQLRNAAFSSMNAMPWNSSGQLGSNNNPTGNLGTSAASMANSSNLTVNNSHATGDSGSQKDDVTVSMAVAHPDAPSNSTASTMNSSMNSAANPMASSGFSSAQSQFPGQQQYLSPEQQQELMYNMMQSGQYFGNMGVQQLQNLHALQGMSSYPGGLNPHSLSYPGQMQMHGGGSSMYPSQIQQSMSNSVPMNLQMNPHLLQQLQMQQQGMSPNINSLSELNSSMQQQQQLNSQMHLAGLDASSQQMQGPVIPQPVNFLQRYSQNPAAMQQMAAQMTPAQLQQYQLQQYQQQLQLQQAMQLQQLQLQQQHMQMLQFQQQHGQVGQVGQSGQGGHSQVSQFPQSHHQMAFQQSRPQLQNPGSGGQ